MSNIGFSKKIKVAFKRLNNGFLKTYLIATGFVWGALEPFFAFYNPKIFSEKWQDGIFKYLCFQLISLIVTIKIKLPKEKVKFNLRGTNTKVEIVFGDLFSFEGYKAIPVSQFFYEGHSIEDISKNSIQAQLIKNKFSGDFSYYSEIIEKELVNIPYKTIKRNSNKEKQYEFGTTIAVNQSNDNFLLFALTKTELSHIEQGDKSNLSVLQKAVDKLYEKTSLIIQGEVLNIPLIGTGISGIGLPPARLLELNLLALYKAVKKNHITEKIRIVIWPDKFEDVDLEEIKSIWIRI